MMLIIKVYLEHLSFIINNKLFWGQDRIEFVLKEAQKLD